MKFRAQPQNISAPRHPACASPIIFLANIHHGLAASNGFLRIFTGSSKNFSEYETGKPESVWLISPC
jgi:hypothetical protein